METNSGYVDPLKFFGARDDASLITWAHGVNSRDLLWRAVNDSTIMMLEADVSLINGPGGAQIPFMAHSSNDPSDITLEEWILLVNENGRKGIKLDFKSIGVVFPSLAILQEHAANIKVPLWLNADIVGAGPATASGPGVDAQQFLRACQVFPESALSIGWVTNCPLRGCNEGKYSWENVKTMLDAINNHSESSQPLTFPVRAVFVLKSARQLRWLADLTAHRKPTFTIWTNIADVLYTRVSDLLLFRTHFPGDMVYYDLLDWMLRDFNSRKNDFPPNSTSDGSPISDLVTPFLTNPSLPNAYIGSRSMLLEDGHGFRTNRKMYSRAELDKFEVEMVFGLGRNISPNNRLVLIIPNSSSGEKDGLRLTVALDGSVALESGILIRNFVNLPGGIQVADLNWTGNRITSYSLPPLRMADVITVTAAEDFRTFTKTFTVRINDDHPDILSHSPVIAAEEQISTLWENHPGITVHFDGTAGAFAVLEKITVTY